MLTMMTKRNKDAVEVFPERLRAARVARGLSQQALAELTGLQSSAIAHFEAAVTKRSNRLPTMANLRVLALNLGISANYLLGLPCEGDSHFDQLRATP